MEHIKDSFHVATPLEQTWNTLLDIERIAPCMPGAQLQEVEGDEYRGIVKIKVGPIQAQYKGAARLEKVDAAARTIEIHAKGRDTRGQGDASAVITVAMAGDASGTTVDIDTQVNVTGRVAQFGRGEMAKISAKLLKQFVVSLERDVLSAPAPSDQAPEVAKSPSAQAAAVDQAPQAEAPASEPTDAAPVRRIIDAPEPEPIELGGTVAKMLLPLAGVALVLFLLFRRRRRR